MLGRRLYLQRLRREAKLPLQRGITTRALSMRLAA